jgi:hypothetical protein
VTDGDVVTDVVTDTENVIKTTVIAVDSNNNTVITQDSTGKIHVVDNPGSGTSLGDVVDLPVVIPPVVPPVLPPVVPPDIPPVLPPVLPPDVTVVQPPKPPKTTSPPPSSPSVGGGGGGDSPTAPLANVFYYGKDFGTQKQQVGPGGRLFQTPYQELSVSKPGAEMPVAQPGRTEENDTDAILQRILSQQDQNVTMDELIRLLG